MNADLTLHYAPDNASLCVRLLLSHMGRPYQTVLVDRAAQGQKSAAYLRLNPNGLIPTLETPDGPIYETGAILLFLADQTPGMAFPAVGDPARGTALTRLFWVANTLHPTLRMLFYPAQYLPDHPAALRQATRPRLTALFAQLDRAWTEDVPAAIAAYVAPLLRWSALYGNDTSWFDLSHYPALQVFAQSYETSPHTAAVCALEGLGPTAFSNPQFPNPPEGSAT